MLCVPTPSRLPCPWWPTDPSKDAEKFAALTALLRDLNSKYLAASPVGPWFLGDSLSIVDLAVIPLVARFSIALALYRGFQPLQKVRWDRGRLCVHTALMDAAWPLTLFGTRP